MKLTYEIDDIQITNMDMTISITMSVENWRKIMRSANSSPVDELRTNIAIALGDLTRATKAKYSIPMKG